MEKDAEIAVFTPLHGLIDINKYGIKELENSALWLTFNGKGHKFRLFMCKLPGTDINVFLYTMTGTLLVLGMFIQSGWTLNMSMRDI